MRFVNFHQLSFSFHILPPRVLTAASHRAPTSESYFSLKRLIIYGWRQFSLFSPLRLRLVSGEAEERKRGKSLNEAGMWNDIRLSFRLQLERKISGKMIFRVMYTMRSEKVNGSGSTAENKAFRRLNVLLFASFFSPLTKSHRSGNTHGSLQVRGWCCYHCVRNCSTFCVYFTFVTDEKVQEIMLVRNDHDKQLLETSWLW